MASRVSPTPMIREKTKMPEVWAASTFGAHTSPRSIPDCTRVWPARRAIREVASRPKAVGGSRRARMAKTMTCSRPLKAIDR